MQYNSIVALFMGGLLVATDLIKIELHKFIRAGKKRNHWQVMLHWNGCGSVPLTGELTRKREAVQAYLRIKRVATHNYGKRRIAGYMPALNAMKDLLQDSIEDSYGAKALDKIL